MKALFSFFAFAISSVITNIITRTAGLAALSMVKLDPVLVFKG